MSQTLFQSFSKMQLALCAIFTWFLIVPVSLSPLLGRNILNKVQASVFINTEPAHFN